MLEAVLKASSVVVVDLVLILRIGVLAAHLPEEGMELVLVAILLEIVQKLDLLAVRLEIRPYIPVNRDDNLALQVLSHAQHLSLIHISLSLELDGTEGWQGQYYTDYPVTLTAQEADGLEFVRWEIEGGTITEGSASTPSIQVQLNGDTRIRAVYE